MYACLDVFYNYFYVDLLLYMFASSCVFWVVGHRLEIHVELGDNGGHWWVLALGVRAQVCMRPSAGSAFGHGVLSAVRPSAGFWAPRRPAACVFCGC